jgi:thioredoxin-related protein
MKTRKAVAEVLKASPMGVAALILLLALVPRSEGRKWEGVDTTVRLSEFRHIKGDGAVMLAVFSDFQCPACAAFERTVYPDIEEELLREPGLRFAMVNLPLSIHKLAAGAAEAVECGARQGKYWEMRRDLFGASPKLTPDRLLSIAESLGLNLDAFRQCEHGEATPIVIADINLAKAFGVTATPTFVMGKIVGDDVHFTRMIAGSPSVQGVASQMNGLRYGLAWSLRYPW